MIEGNEKNETLKDIQQSELMITFNAKEVEHQDEQKALPWYHEKTKRLHDPILRMHNQAIDFYLYTQPTKQEHQENFYFYDMIKKIIETHFMQVFILSPFIHHKLYLKDTEPDAYVLVPILTEQIFLSIKEKLSQIAILNVLPDTGQKYQIYELQVEYYGKTMILRFLQRTIWQQFIINIDQNLSQVTQMKFIYIIFSCMIRQRWMNLKIRPILLISLISIFYHQRRKHKIRTLTENIIKFLQYYGVGPFQQRKINYLGKNRYELIQQGPIPTPFSLWITDKTNISNICLKQFFNILKNRYRLISNYNFDDEQSTIGLLVNPCKKVFYY